MDATYGFARHGAAVDGHALRFRAGGGTPSWTGRTSVRRDDIALPSVVAVNTTSQGTPLPAARRVLTS